MTAQFSDSIMYNGELFGIACEPFEEFLKNRTDIKYDGYCSACWRGYIAKWELIEDKLFLIDLNEFQFGKEEPIINEKTYNNFRRSIINLRTKKEKNMRVSSRTRSTYNRLKYCSGERKSKKKP